MLTKLILVDFVRCKCKNMPCLDSQLLSEYISTSVHDNEKLSINEVPEFLIDA